MPTTRPRDAATLILVRRDEGGARLLMGRRAAGHDFMPGKWVFPGGRLDRADYRAPFAADLAPLTAAGLGQSRRLARQDAARLARALAATAIRETYEEAGLLLATPARHALPVTRGWEGFTAQGLLPDPSGLSFIARAITPPARHRRFDARFLLADARHLVSLAPRDSRELGEVAWFSLDEARELDLPTVTRAVLDTVEAHLAGRPPACPPFWRWTRADPRSAL
jgi:8-oxo-dGTP pyrophosphatase MutT (NUDIX family)